MAAQTVVQSCSRSLVEAKWDARETATTKLVDEVDELFAEAGRGVVVLRMGQQRALQLRRGAMRSVEVKLPTAQNAEEPHMIQVTCRLVTDGEDDPHPPVYELHLAENQRKLEAGSYFAQSVKKSEHSVRFAASDTSIFVGLLAASQTLHVELECRSLSGVLGAERRLSAESRTLGNAAGGEEQATSHTCSPRQRLEAKLSQRQQARPSRIAGGAADYMFGGDVARSAALGTRSAAKRVRWQWEHHLGWRSFSSEESDIIEDMFSFGRASVELRSGKNKGTMTEVFFETMQQIDQTTHNTRAVRRTKAPFNVGAPDALLLRCLWLWLGPCNRFFSMFRRARGSWVRKLSPEFPHHLARRLRQTSQERHSLICIATAGAFAFFLKRQRELHLARCRTALRQLVWYKNILAVSRLQFMYSLLKKHKESMHEKGHRSKGHQRLVAILTGDDSAPALPIDGYLEQAKLGTVRAYARASARMLGRFKELRRTSSRNALTEGDGGSWESADREHLRKEMHRILAARGFTVCPLAYSRARGRVSVHGTSASHRGTRPTTQMSLANPKKSSWATTGNASSASSSYGEVKDTSSLPSAEFSFATPVVPSAPPVKMSSAQYKIFAQKMRQRHEREEQRLRISLEAEALGSCSDIVVTKITKRYRLQFFRDSFPDLPWVGLLDNMMLVIQGKMSFQAPSQRELFKSMLPNFNDARRVALQKLGLVAPLEAALWAHPVVLGMISRLHKLPADGNVERSPDAWKAAIFVGSPGGCADAAGRDAVGSTLTTHASIGTSDQRVRRRLADLGGPFLAGADARILDVTAAPLDWKENALMSGGGDRALDMPQETEPQNIRIERLRKQRSQLSEDTRPRDGEALLVHSARVAQQRYNENWMLTPNMSPKERAFREELLPLLSQVIVGKPVAGRLKTPAAGQARPRATTATAAISGAGRKREAEVQTPPGVAAFMAAYEEQALASGGILWGGLGAPAAQTATTSGRRLHLVGPSNAAPPLPPLQPAAPKTTSDIGELVKRCDALDTIIAMDGGIGGFAQRSPVGWNAGRDSRRTCCGECQGAKAQ